MNDFPTYAAFEAEARARGFDEVLVRDWAPDQVLDTHTHDFSAWVRVNGGEMWLTVGDATQHLLPGQQFEVGAQVPHAERYGAAGANLWVARRRVA